MGKIGGGGRKHNRSKRITLKQKYKVEKKVKEHRKKMKKQARKDPSYRKKILKDPGVPEFWPEKQQLIKQKLKEQFQDEFRQQQFKSNPQHFKAHFQAERLAQQARNRGVDVTNDQIKLLEMKIVSQAQNANLESVQTRIAQEKALSIMNNKFNETTRKRFFKHVRKVLEESDIILQVLDARDPLGCRCFEIEHRLSQIPGKRMIMVLNKIDLVPKHVVQQWLTYLKNFYPVILFKASTQRQNHNLGQVGSTRNLDVASSSSQAYGSNELIQLLKKYSLAPNSKSLKTAVTVGVIGYPNVGKSSIVNSLKRSAVATTGAQAGVTTSIQHVKLDKGLLLIDSPGVVFTSPNSDNMVHDIILRNAIAIDAISDPEDVVTTLLQRCNPDSIQGIYKLGRSFSSPHEFLGLLAHHQGILSKGKPNFDAAARLVLRDWSKGKIPFYTLPPKEFGKQNSNVHVSTQLISELAPAFEFDANSFLEQVPRDNSTTFVEFSSVSMVSHKARDKAVSERIFRQPSPPPIEMIKSTEDNPNFELNNDVSFDLSLENPTIDSFANPVDSDDGYSFATDFIPAIQAMDETDDSQDNSSNWKT